jgi:uncharacterized protein YdeI (YjbR/CyaY-like superfamily)
MNAKEENGNPKIDAYLSKAKKWREEFEELRMIILDFQMTEELKWASRVTRFRTVTSLSSKDSKNTVP